MSDYEHVGGGLKLKKHKKKKKKKHSKTDVKALKETLREEAKVVEVEESDAGYEMTPAERAFAREQAKREAARIREKATRTHKEKVQELNKKLDTMTEHHDIPKVSWTK